MPQTGVIFTCHWGNILYREQMVENFNNVTRKPCFSPVLALFRLQYLLEILCNLQKKKNGSEVALRLKELFFMIQSLWKRKKGDLNWNLIWVEDKWLQADINYFQPKCSRGAWKPSHKPHIFSLNVVLLQMCEYLRQSHISNGAKKNKLNCACYLWKNQSLPTRELFGCAKQ